MDDLTDTRHISRLEIVDTGRRRRWSAAEKLWIVEESFSAPRLASATARRHGISNQLLFAWRKTYREGRLGDIAGFVPAVMVPEQPEKGTGTRTPLGSGIMAPDASPFWRVLMPPVT
jgi:transposase